MSKVNPSTYALATVPRYCLFQGLIPANISFLFYINSSLSSSVSF